MLMTLEKGCKTKRLKWHSAGRRYSTNLAKRGVNMAKVVKKNCKAQAEKNKCKREKRKKRWRKRRRKML